MSSVDVRSIAKKFGKVSALNDVSVTVDDGQLLVLLGPSGCGKTTTLRSIAGLETPDEGAISLGGRPVFDAARGIDVAADKRKVGMVFQNYALWPHMTVGKNLGYPLRVGWRRGTDIEGTVREIARIVECDHLLDRYPMQLSGGQQQRVALARALVAQPSLVLFDEPLSNLDERLRGSLRAELRGLKEELGFTGVYVTHDQKEALHLGDVIAVMMDGVVEQFGTPREVFEEPATRKVAEFLGGENKLQLHNEGEVWSGSGSRDLELRVPGLRSTPEVTVVMRPSSLRMSKGLGQDPDFVALRLSHALVRQARYLGSTFEYVVAWGEERFRVVAGVGGHQFVVGDSVDLVVDMGELHLFDADGRAIPVG